MSLPDNLVDLIEVAINDMKAVKADTNYSFNVNYWHMSCQSKCVVCVAGAIMAKSLNSDPNISVQPSDFYDDSIYHKLTLINFIREGKIFNAKRVMERLGWNSDPLFDFFLTNKLVGGPTSIYHQLRDGKTTAWETLLCHLKNS